MPHNRRRELPIAARPALSLRDLVSILSVSAGGFMLADPPSGDLDLRSTASVIFSLLAFTAGMLLLYGTLAGARTPPLYVEFLTSVAVSSSFAVLVLYRFPAGRASPELPASIEVVEDAIAGCPVPAFVDNMFFSLFWRKKVIRPGCI